MEGYVQDYFLEPCCEVATAAKLLQQESRLYAADIACCINE